MIICSSSNIDLIQGVSGYGTVADGATDWRIENTATGVFNILNSPNLLAPNVSIIDAGNIGIGTIPVSGTNKLQVQGDTSVSGLITATRTTAGTNDILAMRYDSNNGIRFQQTLVAANDVRYDIIQRTNNADYTSPAISIYKGNVGIGTNNPNAELQITCTSTATNPDTGGTIIGLYVHNPTNTASQNSVILNRIAGTTAGKVIYAFNVAGSYGCSLSINGNDTTNRLLRFNNNSDATGTDIMVINNNNGNVGIGTQADTTGSHKLSITGNVNVSGGYFVAGTAFKPANAGLADTATALATSRNINGVAFNGTAAIDIPYFNLTNKITAGTGISITDGSASSSPVISTNLSAGTNVTFTGTAPNITINAAGGGSSQWLGSGSIYYTGGNVGIGTSSIQSSYKLQVQGNAWVENQLVFNDSYRSGGGADYACNKISLYGGGNTPATTSTYGFGVAAGAEQFEYFSYSQHVFYTGTRGGTTYGDERMRIKGNGNVGIGTNNPIGKLDIRGGYIYMNGNRHIQPFSRIGEVSGIHYFDIPTLFDLAEVYIHSTSIVFQWQPSGASGLNLCIFAQIGENQYSPSNAGYKESIYNSNGYSGGSGNLIAISIEEGAVHGNLTKITFTRSPNGVSGNNTYMTDTIYNKVSNGTTHNISFGTMTTSGTGDFTHIRLGFNNNGANITGKYTMTYYPWVSV